MICAASTHLQFKQIVVNFIATPWRLNIASILPDDLDHLEHCGAGSLIYPSSNVLDRLDDYSGVIPSLCSVNALLVSRIASSML